MKSSAIATLGVLGLALTGQPYSADAAVDRRDEWSFQVQSLSIGNPAFQNAVPLGLVTYRRFWWDGSGFGLQGLGEHGERTDFVLFLTGKLQARSSAGLKVGQIGISDTPRVNPADRTTTLAPLLGDAATVFGGLGFAVDPKLVVPFEVFGEWSLGMGGTSFLGSNGATPMTLTLASYPNVGVRLNNRHWSDAFAVALGWPYYWVQGQPAASSFGGTVATLNVSVTRFFPAASAAPAGTPTPSASP